MCLQANQLTVQSLQNSLLDPLQWLHIHLQLSSAAGSPISNILIRPTKRRGNGYEEKFLANGSLLERLKALLKRLQLDDGETLHSFRRGVAQQLKAQGTHDAAILQQLLITTPAVLQKRYLPSGRHHSGVKRVRS